MRLGTSILACIGLVTLAALMFNALRSGGGVDLWNVPKSSYKQFTKAIIGPELNVIRRLADV